MNRIFHTIIEIVFWIAIFSSPLLISFVIAFFIYLSWPNLEWLSIVAGCLGFVTGILYAERVRRKYGCTNYMSRLISTRDISPTDTYDKKIKKKTD